MALEFCCDAPNIQAEWERKPEYDTDSGTAKKRIGAYCEGCGAEHDTDAIDDPDSYFDSFEEGSK